MGAINSGQGVATRNGTTTHTIPFGFTSTSGSLLVFVVAGSVTNTESGSGGWTERLSPVDSAELSVFTKTSTGDSSITLTHNASNYPVAWYCQEFVAGSTWVNGTSESATDITFPTLSSLPGTLVTLGAAYAVGNASAGAVGSTWTAGTEGWAEQYDVSESPSGTDGVYFTVATGLTKAASTTPAGTYPINTAGASAPNSQKVIWAIADAGVTVVKIAENSSTANASTYTDTESSQPLANKGLAIAITNVAGTGGVVTSVTGYGATWTEAANVLGGAYRTSIWTAYSGGSPSASTVAVAFGAGQTGCIFYVFELHNVDMTDFTVQQPTGSASSGTTATTTFATLADAINNVQLMATGTGSPNDIITDATGRWTELGDLSVGSPTMRAMVQWRSAPPDLTATATWSGTAAWAAVGLEIKGIPPATGPTGSGGGDSAVSVVAAGDGTRLELGTGGGVSTVTTTAAGAGTPLEKGTGGGDAAVQVVATGGGTAGTPPTGSGGGDAPVTVTAAGGGKEGHSGGGIATVTATAAGGGMWGHTSGGVATVTVTGQGGGKEGHASGGVAGITVTATGGGSGPPPAGNGGGDSPVLVSATGGGTAFVPAGGGSAAVLVAATGGGEGEVGIFTGPWVGTLGVRVDTATVLVEET